MVIDINRIRIEKGGDYELVLNSERGRGHDISNLERLVEVDREWRRVNFHVSEVRQEINRLNKAIGEIDTPEEKALAIDRAKALNEEMELEKIDEDALMNERKKLLSYIGNILEPTVHISNNEDENPVISTFGDLENSNGLKHFELLTKLSEFNSDTGIQVMGHRGYYLVNHLARLEHAIVSYGIDFLLKRNYTQIAVPLFIKREIMERVAELGDFNETLYRIPAKDVNMTAEGKYDLEKVDTRDDLFLIATAEQPIVAYLLDRVISPSQLPIRFFGISPCFRREAGAHGKDTKGIFRVHQFNKVEQFCIVDPSVSREEHQRMISTSMEFYKSLGIPYRVVSIVSGALNNAAAIKYDLEGWFPSSGEFKELVSCSNCTDYQPRSIHCRLSGSEGKHPHFLNATLTASTRTLSCILENYQTETGINVPEPLIKYINMDFIPFL